MLGAIPSADTAMVKSDGVFMHDRYLDVSPPGDEIVQLQWYDLVKFRLEELYAII